MDLEIKLERLRSTYHGIDQNSLPNEDDTKRIFIVDFLDCIGYNGLLIESQYSVNHHLSNRRPIDYAIKLSESGPPVVLVECKALREKKSLDNFHGQCTEYFQLTQPKNNVDFILLTNGYEYRFYTDLDRDNVLDKTPILSFTLESFSCDDIRLLGLFHKDKFVSSKIKSYVRNLSNRKKLIDFIKSDVIGLKPSFINYVTKEVFKTSKSDKREFVKKNAPPLELRTIIPTPDEVTTEPPDEQWIKVSTAEPKIFNLKGEILYGYRYNSKEVIGKLYWSDMYVEVIKDLFSQEKDLDERKILGKKLDITPFASVKKRGNYKKLFNDYKLCTNNNTSIKIKNLIKALEHFGTKNSLSVKIKITRKASS